MRAVAQLQVTLPARWTFQRPATKLRKRKLMQRSEFRVADAFPQGTVHIASDDLRLAVQSDPAILHLWENLTPLGRNEFICWVEDAKQAKTRERRIVRTGEELLEGKKRPCCWAGCIHRTDKAPSRWQQAVLIDAKTKTKAG